jgi:drug/metabolite transporter (DMT)-like permease
MKFYGEFAAVLTAVCWAFSSVVFTMVGKRVGASTVNHLRLWMAFIVIMVLHTVMFGSPIPMGIEIKRYAYLGISGVIGLSIGDYFLYESYLLIGPRLGMLVMLSAPAFGAFLAWLALGEVLSPIKIIGILVTIGGITWVIREKTNPGNQTDGITSVQFMWGVLLGIGGAVGQAIGMLFSRMGMEGGVSAISANVVRLGSAGLVMAIIALARGNIQTHFIKIKDKKLFLKMVTGVLTGPTLGIILSLEAIAHTQIGVASALMSISPVLLIPVSHFVFKEKITAKAVAGTIVALLGVILLFL